MQWDLQRIYPGLLLRVGPSHAGGLLEFMVDPQSQYDERTHHSVHEESTGKPIYNVGGC